MEDFFIVKANHTHKTFSVHGPTSSDKRAIEDCTRARNDGQEVQVLGGEGTTSRSQAISGINHVCRDYKEVSVAF
jgi:hypothetical protein